MPRRRTIASGILPEALSDAAGSRGTGSPAL